VPLVTHCDSKWLPDSRSIERLYHRTTPATRPGYAQNVKLYVCWNTVQVPRPPLGNPCDNAYKALRAAGHDPEIIMSGASASGRSS